MAVDKDLFLYDMAVAAIMKNEAPYVKEWLDYHIAAGVEHFFIFDNDSSDNLREILQPYIDAGIVTYKFYPGKARQYEAYNETIQDYKFFCRYIAFIDADEFIFPQNGKSIVEVLDEVLADKPTAGALVMNMMTFGSNKLKKADYSKGVLERFTRRAPVDWLPIIEGLNVHGGVAQVKTIANPRKVDFFYNPHFAAYIKGYHAVNEEGVIVDSFYNAPPTVSKMVMYHYPIKSRAEYQNKVNRGTADSYQNIYDDKVFKEHDHNEVFDNSILSYRDARKNIAAPTPKNFNAVQEKVLQTLQHLYRNQTTESFTGKMETILLGLNFVEKFNLQIGSTSNAEILGVLLFKAISQSDDAADFELLLKEFPKILKLQDPMIDAIKKIVLMMIPSYINVLREYNPLSWQKIVHLRYLVSIIEVLDSRR